MTKQWCTKVQTPVGELTVARSEAGLSGIHWEGDATLERKDRDPLLTRAVSQLEEYFNGERVRFDLPLAAEGTAFQKSVWNLLVTIPYGRTLSYGKIARALGDVRKARAVGMANNRNPLAIVVPCHRVIGADGSLVGFGGGLDAKKLLLDLEARHLERACVRCAVLDENRYACPLQCRYCEACTEALSYACLNCRGVLVPIAPSCAPPSPLGREVPSKRKATSLISDKVPAPR